jgi:hypothetical protein
VISISRLTTVAALSVALSGCTQSQDVIVNDLSAYGFTNIETTGYDPLVCGNDDVYATKFEATNTQGQRVAGVVCAGMFFKGGTLRNLHVVRAR